MLKESPLDTKKEIAKIGMTLSLGTLVLTSLNLKSKTSKVLHTTSGVTLLGFSIWHHFLYKPDKKVVKKNNTIEK